VSPGTEQGETSMPDILSLEHVLAGVGLVEALLPQPARWRIAAPRARNASLSGQTGTE